MSTYRFGGSSVVREIVMRKSAGGGMRTFLFARDGITAAQATDIKAAMAREGWHCIPNEQEGRMCLEVRGARAIDSLESALRRGGFVSGKYTRVSSEDDVQFSASERFRENKLWLYGIMNVIADIGITIYGIIRRKLPGEVKDHWEEEVAAAAYFAGSLTFLGFGRGDKSDHHIMDLSQKLYRKLESSGLAAEGSSAANAFFTARNLGLLDRFKGFMFRHTAEIGNSFTGTAGLLYAKAGFKSKNIRDGILGATTMATGYTSAFVEEKAPELNRPAPQTFLGKAWRWVQERPNRVAGYGYLIATLIHGGESVHKLLNVEKAYPLAAYNEPGKFKNPKKWAYTAHGMRLMFALTNAIDEIILSLASKGHGTGVKTDSGVDDTAYAIVADAIVRQPASEQDRLIHELSADFLARPDVLGGDALKIEDALRKRVKDTGGNPWVALSPMRGTQEEAANPVPPKARWQEQEHRRNEPVNGPTRDKGLTYQTL